VQSFQAAQKRSDQLSAVSFQQKKYGKGWHRHSSANNFAIEMTLFGHVSVCGSTIGMTGLQTVSSSCAMHTDNHSKKEDSMALSISSDCRCHPTRLEKADR